ncbi:unnamed protein product, partial [marine sediment metagenome]
MPDNNSDRKGFMGILWDAVSGFFTIGFAKVWTN